MVIGIGFGIVINPLFGLVAFIAAYLVVGFFISLAAIEYFFYWKIIFAWLPAFWSDDVLHWTKK